MGKRGVPRWRPNYYRAPGGGLAYREIYLSGGERKKLHIDLAERALGRSLPMGTEVHHHSESQLVICEGHAYHMLLHVRTRVVRAGGNPNTQRVCRRCGPKPLSEFYEIKNGRCIECAKSDERAKTFTPEQAAARREQGRERQRAYRHRLANAQHIHELTSEKRSV